jgi:hypothetical protein
MYTGVRLPGRTSRRYYVRQPCRLSIAYSIVTCLVLILQACGPSSPADKIARTRSLYSARLNGFVVEEEPIIEEPMPVTGEAVEGAQVESQVGDQALETGGDFEPVALSQRVLLDILIQHDSNEKLPGITVEISMADPNGQEKNHWRVWFDTSDIEKATVTQFTHILEDVSYEEGDGFFVEIRHPVPEEERGEYREFASAS